MNASAHDTLHPGEVMGLFSCVTRDESRAIALEIRTAEGGLPRIKPAQHPFSSGSAVRD